MSADDNVTSRHVNVTPLSRDVALCIHLDHHYSTKCICILSLQIYAETHITAVRGHIDIEYLIVLSVI